MKVRSAFRATTFDVDRLLSLVDSDIELLGELFDLFREDSDRILADARSALESKDPAALWRCAHSLKGAAGNFAASEAVQLAVLLEQQSKAEDLGPSATTLDRLVEILDRLIGELGEFLGELGQDR